MLGAKAKIGVRLEDTREEAAVTHATITLRAPRGVTSDAGAKA